jgi:hypothetical protein
MEAAPHPNISDEELRAFQAQAGDAPMPPTSDAELAAQGAATPAAGAGLTPPGEIVPPAEMPPGEFGPPAPNPTGPAGGASEPWPPLVPAGAPGAVPPGGAPAALSAQPGGGDAGPGGVQGAMGETEAARKESDEAKIKKNEDELRDQAEYRTNRAAELEQRQALDDARMKADAAARTKADAEIKAKSDAIAGFKFKDLWADETTGQKVGRIFASALLAIGAGMQKTPQYAMQILDKEREEDHKKQLDNLGLLKDDYVRARTGMEDADLGRQKIAADINLGRARKDDLMAAQFEETAAKTKNANAGAYAAQLRQDSAKARQDAAIAYEQVHLKNDAAEEKRRLDESQILANEASARLRDRGLGQGHKAGGGGGAGGGQASQQGAALLGQEIEKRKAAGNPMSFAEMQTFALANHVPLTAKAGHVSLGEVIADSGKYAGQGFKAETAGEKSAKTVNDFVRTRLKDDAQLAADLKEKQEVNKALALAKPGPDGNVSGVNFQQAIDATVKAATGLGARPGSIAVFQGSLGGVWDRVMRAIQHGETGQYTPHDVQVLNDALKKQKAYVDGNLSEKEAIYSDEFSKHPTTKDHPDAWKAELRSRFGHAAEGGGGGPLAAGARKKQGGHVYEFKGGDAKDPNNWQAVTQ